MGNNGGLHEFMGWDRNILTVRGGFQWYPEITEEGVTFEDLFEKDAYETKEENNNNEEEEGKDGATSKTRPSYQSPSECFFAQKI